MRRAKRGFLGGLLFCLSVVLLLAGQSCRREWIPLRPSEQIPPDASSPDLLPADPSLQEFHGGLFWGLEENCRRSLAPSSQPNGIRLSETCPQGRKSYLDLQDPRLFTCEKTRFGVVSVPQILYRTGYQQSILALKVPPHLDGKPYAYLPLWIEVESGQVKLDIVPSPDPVFTDRDGFMVALLKMPKDSGPSFGTTVIRVRDLFNRCHKQTISISPQYGPWWRFPQRKLKCYTGQQAEITLFSSYWFDREVVGGTANPTVAQLVRYPHEILPDSLVRWRLQILCQAVGSTKLFFAPKYQHRLGIEPAVIEIDVYPPRQEKEPEPG